MSEVTRGAPGSWQYLGWWDGDQLNLGQTRAQLPANDQDAALLLAMERPGELHHVTLSSTWHIWDGNCHRPDESAAAERMVMAFAHRSDALLTQCRQVVYAAEAGRLGPGATMADIEAAVRLVWKTWEPVVKYLAGLKTTAKSRSLLAKLAEVVGCAEEVMADRHPGLVNFRNGTVSLITGQIKPHDPADMITYCLDVDWVPGAQAPWFTHLMRTACGWSDPVTDYLWRVLGYCLIGDNREQKIFFLAGHTASGKSQLLDAVSEVLGPLGHRSQNALISVARQGRNARVEWSCRGARLVTITETSGHNTTDEAQVKRLTGESWISVDRHYSQTEIKIPVTFTIIQATNEMQTLTNFDEAMRRRTEVLPMGPPVPEEYRVTGLGKTIAAREAEGIAAMLVAGAMAYFRDGLHPPAEVMAETARYAAEQNTLEDFLADCAMFIPVPLSPNGQGVPAVGRSELWRAYLIHAAGSPKLRKSQFFDQMKAHPGVTYSEGSRRFEGILLTDDVRSRMEAGS